MSRAHLCPFLSLSAAWSPEQMVSLNTIVVTVLIVPSITPMDTPGPDGVPLIDSSGNMGSNFRAKVAEMKVWKPRTVPSNRDKLELYALHKQVVSGDAPKDTAATAASSSSSNMSPAERAKLNAWRSKRGLTQSEAMSAYLVEADRQLKIYGNSATEGGSTSETSSMPETPRNFQTPMNTPADTTTTAAGDDSSQATAGTGTVLLTPRGLAAVPLLCAACSESRISYLHRLSSTGAPSNGWWRKQEPLCAADPHSIFALPENLVISLASTIEYISLTLSSEPSIRDLLGSIGIRPAVFQSMLWPLHNVLLVLWILVLFISTLAGSAIVMAKTILLGSKRTGIRLEDVFAEDIYPCRMGASSLCQSHQTITVRLLGLILYPLGMVCELAESSRSKAVVGRDGGGLMIGSAVFVTGISLLWWYWLILLPWVGVFAMGGAVSISWCFGLIELASIL